MSSSNKQLNIDKANDILLHLQIFQKLSEDDHQAFGLNYANMVINVYFVKFKNQRTSFLIKLSF